MNTPNITHTENTSSSLASFSSQHWKTVALNVSTLVTFLIAAGGLLGFLAHRGNLPVFLHDLDFLRALNNSYSISMMGVGGVVCLSSIITLVWRGFFLRTDPISKTTFSKLSERPEPTATDDFHAKLKSWADEAPPEEVESRRNARMRIFFCWTTKNDNLVLSNQNLTTFPPVLDQLTHLKHLDMSGNKLTSIPKEIGLLSRLENFNLDHNSLQSLPSEIAKLTHLKSLNLSNNAFKTLPSEIEALVTLERLTLYRNQLTSLPQGIGKLTHLKMLDLTLNRLGSLPSDIGNLTQLEVLNLSENLLTTLPPEIGSLTRLEFCFLSHNTLTSLPKEILNLPPKAKVTVYFNPPELQTSIAGLQKNYPKQGPTFEFNVG